MYTCVSVLGHVNVDAGVGGSQESMSGLPRAGVIGGFESLEPRGCELNLSPLQELEGL